VGHWVLRHGLRKVLPEGLRDVIGNMVVEGLLGEGVQVELLQRYKCVDTPWVNVTS
jgi:hypothetical protein